MNTKNQIANLKAGDMASFHHLYNEWSGKLYNFVLRISYGDKYLAEEMVQEVFVSVWEKREQLDETLSFGAYLFTIAKNRLANIYKRKLLELEFQEHCVRSAKLSENTTEKEVEYRFLNEYVESVIEQLPPARKEIYRLSRKEHLTNKRIASILNISENTVESQMTKAIAFIRDKVLDHYGKNMAVLFCCFFTSHY